ncbi:MAG: hypothetical protein CMM52_12985 [Rhodospirillaceae bacterium]|nr:hypothetical protein [Rhodospirillaceae bacterium]|tara:strand:+ start:27266 stop:28531 length:1266 start_codon:yes stop_codon:yes gene_type:complete
MKDKEAAEIPWQVQAAIYSAGMFSFSMVLISSLVLTVLADSLTDSEFLIGLIIGSRYFLTLALSIHGGALMDRLGTRRVMVGFAIVATFSPFLFPAALMLPFGTAVTVIILLQMIAGVSDAMVWIGAQALSSHIMQGRRRYVGRLTAIVRLGAFFGPPLFGFIWDFTDIWTTFIAMGLWSGAGLIAVLKIPKTSQEKDVADKTRIRFTEVIPRFSDYLAAFRLIAIPAVGLILMVTMVRIGGTGIQNSFYIVFLNEGGISATAVGVLIGFAQLLASAGSLASATLARIIHPHWLVVVAVFLTVITIAITPLLVIDASTVLIMLLLAMAIGARGLCLGVSQPMEISVLSRSVGSTEQGVAAGLRTTVNRFASAGIPPVMGAIAELVGIRNSFYVLGVVLMIVILCAALFVSRHPKLGKQEEE